MKFLLFSALFLTICASIADGAKCKLCVNIVTGNTDSTCTCTAPNVQTSRKVSCGPACTASAYCCAPPSPQPCLLCSAVTVGNTNSTCTCLAPLLQTLIRVSCGSACTASAYCCA